MNRTRYTIIFDNSMNGKQVNKPDIVLHNSNGQSNAIYLPHWTMTAEIGCCGLLSICCFVVILINFLLRLLLCVRVLEGAAQGVVDFLGRHLNIVQL